MRLALYNDKTNKNYFLEIIYSDQRPNVFAGAGDFYQDVPFNIQMNRYSQFDSRRLVYLLEQFHYSIKRINNDKTTNIYLLEIDKEDPKDYVKQSFLLEKELIHSLLDCIDGKDVNPVCQVVHRTV